MASWRPRSLVFQHIVPEFSRKTETTQYLAVFRKIIGRFDKT